MDVDSATGRKDVVVREGVLLGRVTRVCRKGVLIGCVEKSALKRCKMI